MITFVSCYYKIKSKFDSYKYKRWIGNFLSIVNNFNLVIYTNKESLDIFNDFNEIISKNNKIKIVIREFEEFVLYKYSDKWITNQIYNRSLSGLDWKLIMLWCEKIYMVEDAKLNNYYNTSWYSWCDIGYFRNEYRDTNTCNLYNFPNIRKIESLDISKIYYARVENSNIVEFLIDNINNNDNYIIPENQVSIAGGFFIIQHTMIEWYSKTFMLFIDKYFLENRVIKDDQMIILNCVAKNPDHFILVQEYINNYDNWFLFQRWLNY